MRMRRRLPLALTALLLALGGCGGESGDKSPSEVTAANEVAQSNGGDPSVDDHPRSKGGASREDRGKHRASQDNDRSADGRDLSGDNSPEGDQATSKVHVEDIGKPAEGDDDAAATETVESYYQALAAGDNELACKLLSRKARQEVDALLDQVPKRSGAGEDCADLLGLLYGQVPDEMLADFGEAEVTKVDLKGRRETRAIAYLEIPEQERIAIRLSFDRGAWRLDQVSGSYA